MNVAIVGGGIGGLAAALALLRKGVDVDVYEQSSVLKEVGAGVQLTPNGAKVLLALGLADELEQHGTATTGKVASLWDTGQSKQFMQLGSNATEQYGAPYLTFHRADLHDLLLRAVLREKPAAVHLNKSCVDFKDDGKAVTLVFSDGTQASATAMIGADGVHSRVRQILFGKDRASFTGCMAWRGLIPAERLGPSINLKGGGMWLGPAAHIVTYPIRKGAMLNFIGMVDSDGWTLESWNAEGSLAECQADFVGWHPDVQQMIENIAIPYKWALIVREPLDRWSVGRVSLLGDASHSTLPFLSQGANMAIEDSLVLARCFEACPENIEKALRLYESTRRERTAKIVRSSAAQVTRVHSPELANPEGSAQYVAREWGRKEVGDRYQWIYGYDARTAPLSEP